MMTPLQPNSFVLNCSMLNYFRNFLDMSQAQLFTQGRQVNLFVERENAHLIYHAGHVPGKDAADERVAGFGQLNRYAAAVIGVALALNQAALFQIINNQSHVAPAFQNFFTQLMLVHGAKMQKRLKHAELANGELFRFQVPVNAGRHGLGGT